MDDTIENINIELFTTSQIAIKDKRHTYYMSRKKDKIDIELEKRLKFMNITPTPRIQRKLIRVKYTEQERKENRAKYTHDYYIKNIDKIKAYGKMYMEKNKASYIAYKKQYDLDNYDRLHTYRLAYYQLHHK